MPQVAEVVNRDAAALDRYPAAVEGHERLQAAGERVGEPQGQSSARLQAGRGGGLAR